MFEVFLALILVPYFIWKFVSTRNKEMMYDATQRRYDNEYEQDMRWWLDAVTDRELEDWAYRVVNDVGLASDHSAEIERVLKSEFGMKKGAVKTILNPKYNIYCSELKIIFSRILLANRGKISERDAKNGISISGAHSCSTWRLYINYENDRDAGYTPTKLALWINKQLSNNGVDAQLVLESWRDKGVIKYYPVCGDEDSDHLIDSMVLPQENFSHSYRPVSHIECLRWSPSIRKYRSGDINIEPMNQYKHWIDSNL